jgi:sulfide:quinone oxidoreductase
MSRILIAGGGFGGVVAAESLERQIGGEHQIIMVSRSRNFLFYPALVRLAFGEASRTTFHSNHGRDARATLG